MRILERAAGSSFVTQVELTDELAEPDGGAACRARAPRVSGRGWNAATSPVACPAGRSRVGPQSPPPPPANRTVSLTVVASKTGGCRFESCRPCPLRRAKSGLNAGLAATDRPNSPAAHNRWQPLSLWLSWLMAALAGRSVEAPRGARKVATTRLFGSRVRWSRWRRPGRGRCLSSPWRRERSRRWGRRQ